MWNLTIKSVTKNNKLSVEKGGFAKDIFGQIKSGFNVTGKINKKDFGLSWGGSSKTGGVILGDDVKVDCEVQLTEQQ